VPFTISHIAAVIPLHRPLTRVAVFSAAVIGSMVPDFGLLLPDPLSRWQTHSLPAILHFCLPVGLCTYLLLEWLIKPAMLEVLPNGAYARLHSQPPPRLDTLSHWLWVIVALLFGTITHLVWDGFTHENALGVRMFPVLSDYGLDVQGHELHLYAWLQLLSSILGLVGVAGALLLWLRHAPAPAAAPARRLRVSERMVWRVLYVALPFAAVAWVLIRAVTVKHVALYSGPTITRAAVDFLRGAALSLVLVSELLSLRLRQQSRC